MISQKISAWFKRISKLDFVCVLLLLSATITVRLLIILNTPFLYGQDAYRFLGEARDFASTGAIQFRERVPFVFFLGVFIKIFGSVFGEIYASRFFMLIASGLMIIVIYLFGLRLSGRLLGLLAGLFVTFEPYLLEWSTVPYTEVFAISTGLIALYFAISDKKLHTILSLICFYLAILTRPELYLPLVIPILIYYFHKILKIRSKEGMALRLLTPFIFAIFLYFLPCMVIYLYVQSWGAFGLVQRVALFLTPELLSNTLEASFRFYDEQLLNRAMYVCVELVLGLSILNIFVRVRFEKMRKKFPILIRYRGVKRIRDAFSSGSGMIAFCLFLIFVIYIIVLTIFSYGYNWAFYVASSDMTNIDILRKAVVIIQSLPVRYLILPRILISYPLVYPLVLVARKFWAVIVHEK